MAHDPIKALEDVQAKITVAAKAAKRTPADIQLIAVSKTHGTDSIRPTLRAGHPHFGENRVQEAQQKWPPLKEEFPDTQLHLIGPLQTNKVKDALALFDVFHTVDRPKLAAKLANGNVKGHPCARRRFLKDHRQHMAFKRALTVRDAFRQAGAGAFCRQCARQYCVEVVARDARDIQK